MSGEPQLFRVNPENRQSERIEEVDFARLGLRERQDIQEWVAANPSMLDDDLLIIDKEFSGFDRTDERLDLLAVDSDGKLVIIELKRDDTGTDVHWQAIKYASYFQRAGAEDIVGLAAKYWGDSRDAAITRLLQHLGADDLNALNNDQRIILASHRVAPEVTSAALWLNQRVPGEENMITCVKLTPHQDTHTGALYVQASTIIPVPGVEDYLVGVGHGQQPDLRGCVTKPESGWSESFEHQVDHRYMNPGLAGFGQFLVVFAESSAPTQPGQCALHHPPAGQHLEVVAVRTAAHHLQQPTAGRPSPRDQLAGISGVSPDDLEPRETAQQSAQHQLGSVPVLNTGSMHHHREE